MNYLQSISQLIDQANTALHGQEKFATGVLAVQARRLAETYPLDQTAVSMANFLSRRADQDSGQLIARAELQDVYTKFYTRNNKVAGLFAVELDLKAPEAIKTPTIFARSAKEGESLMAPVMASAGDSLLGKALTSMLDPSVPYLPYSIKTAKSVEKNCLYELNRLGVPPKKVEIVAGQTDVVICQAAYETPKGLSHVLIPVEVKQETGLLPTVFLGREGFLDLTAQTLTEHLVATAGKSFKIDFNRVLTVVAEAKNGRPEPLSEVERIVIKASAGEILPTGFTNEGILYAEVDAKTAADLQAPEYELPEEIQSLSAQLTSRLGSAEFILGKEAVAKSRNLVSQALKSFGYHNAQVGVLAADGESLTLGVSVAGGLGFRVPMKIANKKLEAPRFILAGDRLLEFSAEGISEVIAQNQQDTLASTAASPLFDLSPSQIVSQVRVAMERRDLPRAEEGLRILQAGSDPKAYKTAYDIYLEGLKNPVGIKKQASAQCSHQYKSASSQYLLCSQTNLPVHKVYQDRHGDCRPLYRKGQAESSEGGMFMNSKLFGV